MDESEKIIKDWAQCFNGIIWTYDIPWVYESKILKPLTMPHQISEINREKVQEIIKSKNALLAYWTNNWNTNESAWWWTCCDNSIYDIENIEDKRGRRDVRKGNRECSVERIKTEDFAELTYDIYSKAFKSYKYHNLNVLSRSQYSEYIFRKSRFQGYELWGAFVSNKIAAYASVVVINDAVLIESAKSDYELQVHCPNNALFYRMTKHYLCERGKLYITNGPRTLLHPTNINDLLIRMGYRKIFCRLNVELSGLSKLILHSGINKWINTISLLDKIFPGQLAKLKSFLKLVEISKTFEQNK